MKLIAKTLRYRARVFTLLPDSTKVKILPLIYKLEEKNFSIGDIDSTITIVSGSFDYKVNSGVDKNGQYEAAMCEKLVETLRVLGGKSFIDVGGGAGYYSILASHIIPPENIHAFEPDIIQYASFQLNNRKYCRGNVKANRLFVGNRVNKNMTTLDEYCLGNGLSPGLIKMDIEGWEYFAIDGMLKILAAYHPFIMIEFHERKLRQLFGVDATSAKNAINKIEKLGYRIQYNGHHYFANRHGGVPSREWVGKPPNDVNYAIFCSPI